jgi:hypothetical protein
LCFFLIILQIVYLCPYMNWISTLNFVLARGSLVMPKSWCTKDNFWECMDNKSLLLQLVVTKISAWLCGWIFAKDSIMAPEENIPCRLLIHIRYVLFYSLSLRLSEFFKCIKLVMQKFPFSFRTRSTKKMNSLDSFNFSASSPSRCFNFLADQPN